MNHAIILAAGRSSRLRSNKDKLFLKVHGHPVLYYAIMAFNENPHIDEIIIAANAQNKEKIQKLLRQYNFPKAKKIVPGGTTRQKSLEKSLKHINPSKDDLIVVHNGANPLPSQKEINAAIKEAKKHGACIVGHFLTSTIKEVDPDSKHIIKSHDRKQIFAAETPQVVRYDLLARAIAKNLEATDEAGLIEALPHKVKYIEADENNFKITTQKDYLRLKTLMGDAPEDFRIGLGQDSHAFDPDKKGLQLGGISLPKHQKLKANSDGDVILHAIFNAISQSLGEQSLGFFADPLCKRGIKDSKTYLDIIMEKARKQKLKLNSLGVMIECKIPQIDPLNTKLKKSLSKILRLDPVRIGINATSGEELTAFGRGEGVQCFAIVSLTKEK